MGFPVPLNYWVKNLESYANEYLSNADWLKNDALNEMIADSKKSERFGQILWMFINIEMFRKKYFTKEWRY